MQLADPSIQQREHYSNFINFEVQMVYVFDWRSMYLLSHAHSHTVTFAHDKRVSEVYAISLRLYCVLNIYWKMCEYTFNCIRVWKIQYTSNCDRITIVNKQHNCTVTREFYF